MKQEIWKDIPWFNWDYQASNLGNIKSLKYWKNKMLKSILFKNWYLRITLTIYWIPKNYPFQRMILSSFIPNPENKPQVNHIDWNKLNNNLDNLEWVTQSENLSHRYNILKQKYPMQWHIWKFNKKSKPVLQFDLQNNFIKEWENACDVMRKTDMNQSSISACCKWKYKQAYWFIWKFS